MQRSATLALLKANVRGSWVPAFVRPHVLGGLRAPAFAFQVAATIPTFKEFGSLTCFQSSQRAVLKQRKRSWPPILTGSRTTLPHLMTLRKSGKDAETVHSLPTRGFLPHKTLEALQKQLFGLCETLCRFPIENRILPKEQSLLSLFGYGSQIHSCSPPL